MSLPHGASATDYDVLVDTPTLTITLDVAVRDPILEVVSKPTRVLSRAANDGRQEKSAVFAQFDDVLARLRRARTNQPLASVFPAEAGYNVDPGAGDLRIRPRVQGSAEQLYMHYTVGIPVAGMIPVLEHVQQHGRQDSALTRAVQRHLADCLRFGREAAAPFHQWLAAHRELHAFARPDDVAALEGFLALTYTQTVALAQEALSRFNLPKNFAAVTSRVSLRARNGLGTAALAFLDHYATSIAGHFTASFRSYFKQVRDVPDILADRLPPRRDGDRPLPASICHYLDNALLSRPARLIGHNDALGIRNDFWELDHN
ncbi:hypothetical protein ACWGJX_45680 [Streptomyces sp. NPDC054775]